MFSYLPRFLPIRVAGTDRSSYALVSTLRKHYSSLGAPALRQTTKVYLRARRRVIPLKEY
jgi:hypothetical protein